MKKKATLEEILQAATDPRVMLYINHINDDGETDSTRLVGTYANVATAQAIADSLPLQVDEYCSIGPVELSET